MRIRSIPRTPKIVFCRVIRRYLRENSLQFCRDIPAKPPAGSEDTAISSAAEYLPASKTH